MEKTLEELKQEAEELGIVFQKNIGAARLAEKIEEFYTKDSEENTELSGVKEVEAEDETESQTKTRVADLRKEALRTIKEQERANMETEIVRVTMVDRREASTATHAYFGTGDTAVNIPLDTFVEIPRIIVDLAKRAKALTHVDKNGMTVSKLAPKYVVEYKDN